MKISNKKWLTTAIYISTKILFNWIRVESYIGRRFLPERISKKKQESVDKPGSVANSHSSTMAITGHL